MLFALGRTPENQFPEHREPEVQVFIIEEQAKKRLRELIEEGLQSGSGRTLTPKVEAELKTRALGSRR